jgi:hypothetical protein
VSPGIYVLETESPNLYVDGIWKFSIWRELGLVEVMKEGTP